MVAPLCPMTASRPQEVQTGHEQLPRRRDRRPDALRRCPVLWRGGTEMPDLTAAYVRHSPYEHRPLRATECSGEGNIARNEP